MLQSFCMALCRAAAAEGVKSLQEVLSESWGFHNGVGSVETLLRLLAGPDAFMLEALFRNEVWGFMLQVRHLRFCCCGSAAA